MKRYGGSETIIKSESQAERMVVDLRKRTTLLGPRKSILWKIYYSFDISTRTLSKPKFVGLIGANTVHKSVRLLVPNVLLVPQYHGQGLGTKALMCVMVKMLDHKSWFFKNYSGVFLEITENNEASISFKRRIVSNTESERKNRKRPDGLWPKDTQWYFNKATVFIRRYLFSMEQAFKIILTGSQSQHVKKRDLIFFFNDNKGNRPQTVCAASDLGIALFLPDVIELTTSFKHYVEELQMCELTPSEESGSVNPVVLPLVLVHKFEISLSMDLQMSFCLGNPNCFYLLFFIERNSGKPHEFECYKYHSKTCSQHYYIALPELPSESFAVRFTDAELYSVRGYMLELNIDVFMKRSELHENIKSIWMIERFPYFKHKRRAGQIKYPSSISMFKTWIKKP